MHKNDWGYLTALEGNFLSEYSDGTSQKNPQRSLTPPKLISLKWLAKFGRGTLCSATLCDLTDSGCKMPVTFYHPKQDIDLNYLDFQLR